MRSISTSLHHHPAHYHDYDASRVLVVSACSRGIGLEFTKQLLQNTASVVVGIHRRSTTNSSQTKPPTDGTSSTGVLNTELEDLRTEYGDRLHLIEADLTDQHSISQVGEAIASKFGSVDMLLNVAGILGDGKSVPGPERTITAIDRDWLSDTLQINLVGHIMMTQTLFPLLKKSKSDPIKSKVVNISARVGSISDNRLGGWYSYRISKAALNMFTKTLSIEAKRFDCVVLSVHPGTTNTDLSKPFQSNVTKEKLFSVEYSVRSMLEVIIGADLADSGKFFAYDGSEIVY